MAIRKSCPAAASPKKLYSLFILYQSVRLPLILKIPLESNSQICISGKGNDSVFLIDLHITL